MNILYKFATRSRPEKFFKCLDNIQEMTRHEDYKILVSLDHDDTDMNNMWVNRRLVYYPNTFVRFASSENKIHAINRDMEWAGEWDILICMSDDMVFIEPGFDLNIIMDMLKFFPGLDGVLHYHDGSSTGEQLMTMSIMGRKYYERDGHIYDPRFKSLFCDNYAMDVARKRGCLKYIPEPRLFKHNNPMHNGNIGADKLFRRNQLCYYEDRATYEILTKELSSQS